MKACIAALTIALTAYSAYAAEYHVSTTGLDGNDGSQSKPLKTISAAAQIAQPGDIITVHQGVYRERVDPPRGGTSDETRIVYRAAEGEKVVVKGSELVKDWQRVGNDTWKATLPNSFFGNLNPFDDLIRGDWCNNRRHNLHTGAVYLNGHWLTETSRLEEVMKPADEKPLWFAEVDDTKTMIWAQFKGVDPNKEQVEVNVRRTVFYPEKPGINYIAVRGFHLRHAATPWAPPTAEQIGLIGTHWSKGWIIEDNEVSYSTCAGITLGKHGDEFDNTSANSAEGYVKTIERGLARGWSKENIGSHVVRNNHIHDCEQTGIAGSLGAAFSIVEGNTIHDIYVRRLFSGAEMAGIKFHGAIDTVIRNNHVYRCDKHGGIWLDWLPPERPRPAPTGRATSVWRWRPPGRRLPVVSGNLLVFLRAAGCPGRGACGKLGLLRPQRVLPQGGGNRFLGRNRTTARGETRPIQKMKPLDAQRLGSASGVRPWTMGRAAAPGQKVAKGR